MKAETAGFRPVGTAIVFCVDIGIGNGQGSIHAVEIVMDLPACGNSCLKARHAAQLDGLVGVRTGKRCFQLFNILHHALLILFRSKMCKSIGKHLGGRDASGMNQTDRTKPINDHRGGICLQLHGLGPVGVAGCHGEGQFQFFFECSDSLIRAIHRIHGQKLNPVAVCLIRFLQIRKFLTAGAAVYIPEVQHHGILFLQQF